MSQCFLEQPPQRHDEVPSGGGSSKGGKENQEYIDPILSLIAEDGMLELLKYPERLEREIQATKERLFDFFDSQCSLEKDISEALRKFFDGEAGKEDLEELTLIRFYGSSYRPDPRKDEYPFREELFRHSLGVFRIVAEAYPKLLLLRASGGGAAFALGETLPVKDLVENEMGGVSSLEAYLTIVRAAGIHDVGKVSLPEFVVYNSITDKESLSILKKSSDVSMVDSVFAQFNQDPEFPVKGKTTFSKEERENIFEWIERCFDQGKGKRISPKIPVGVLMDADIEKNEALSSNEKSKISLDRQAKLTKMNIDSKSPLGTVLDQHEVRSETMIEALQHNPILVSLAAHHHNKEDTSHPLFGTSSEDVALTLLHVSDIFEALTAERSYKSPMPLEQVLAILVEESVHEHLHSKVIAAFIDFQIQKAFGGPSVLERRNSWRLANISDRFRKIVEDFLVQDGIWKELELTNG